MEKCQNIECFAGVTYATTLISPSLGTGSSENILCIDEFMLRSVKTLNVFAGVRYATTLISPSLGTRSSENILCFDEFLWRSVRTHDNLQGGAMQPLSSAPPLVQDLAKTYCVLMSLCKEVSKHLMFCSGRYATTLISPSLRCQNASLAILP